MESFKTALVNNLSSYLLAAVLLLAALLRFYQLGSNPPSLYWDEASLGYNAYAISQTLHDEHGEFLPYSRFIAFGDYKPPVYIYSSVLPVRVFGLNEFSTRFVSAVSGTLIVLGAYLLAQELFTKRKHKIAFLGALFIAISPWTLQISRAAFEANEATALMIFGIVFYLRFLRAFKFKDLFLSAVLLLLPLYTFNSHRIVVPALVGLLTLTSFWRKDFLVVLKKQFAKFILWGLIFLILLAPSVPHLLSPEGRLRFEEVAWINDLAPITQSNARIKTDGYTLIGKTLHNRRIVYSLEFLQHFSDHFNADYLFLNGDVNPKFSIQQIGEFYWYDAVLLATGIFILLKKRDKITILLIGWIVLAIIPAALARETPHALRTLPMLPVPQMIAALGAVSLFEVLNSKYKLIAGIISALVIVIFLANYLFLYHFWYPKHYSSSWQYGYKQMVTRVTNLLPNYTGAVVTENYGRPYIYFLFYNQVSPIDYLATRQASRDSFGFWTVHSIANIEFSDRDVARAGYLYVRPPGRSPQGAEIVDRINDLSGQEIFEISAR